VGHIDRGRGKTQGASLCLGRFGELGGGDKHPRDAPALKIGDVVHTARRA